MARKDFNPTGKKAKARKPTILDVGDLSWVKRGKNRRDVLLGLGDKVLTPRDLAEATSTNQRSVSRTLQDFLERGIAECLNPDEPTGRLYRLTRKGRNLASNM